jgi:hypothetical protein
MPAGGKPPKGEEQTRSRLSWVVGFAPSPSADLPEVITYAQGPLALEGGWFSLFAAPGRM